MLGFTAVRPGADPVAVDCKVASAKVLCCTIVGVSGDDASGVATGISGVEGRHGWSLWDVM